MPTHYDSLELLHERDASNLLKVSIYQLQRWRCYGGGPQFVRVGGKNGRAVRYRRCDIDAYIQQNLVASYGGTK
jgi:predicted DNA-binding transcriptional regulator AlpA